MYQVWTKTDYEGSWQRKDCGDLATAQQELFAALKRGAEPLLTVEVPFNVNIEIKEVETVEATKAETEPGEGARVKSKGKIRPGDTPAVSELNP